MALAYYFNALEGTFDLVDVGGGGGGDHHTLANLTGFDDHTQYLYLAGRAGGQTGIAGTVTGDYLGGPGGLGAGDRLTLAPNTATYAGGLVGGMATSLFYLEQNGLGQTRLVLGTPGVDPSAALLPNGVLQFLVTQDGGITGAFFGAFSTNDDAATGPNFFGIRGRGPLAAPTATQDGDILLGVGGTGFDSANAIALLQAAANIQFAQGGPPQAGYVTGKTLFNTTDTAGNFLARLLLDGDGHCVVTADSDLTLPERATTPPTPATTNDLRVYKKSDKLVVQWFDGAAAHYFYLDLTTVADQKLIYSAVAP